MKNKRGFTLVEIMIVVAIIALLATIALPGLLRTRLSANESSAIGALRTIATAAETYRVSQTAPSYPADIGDLCGEAPFYVTGLLAVGGGACAAATTTATKSGYNFGVAGDANSFAATAEPVTAGTTGNREFCIDETGVMRAVTDGSYGVPPASAVTDCTGTPLS